MPEGIISDNPRTKYPNCPEHQRKAKRQREYNIKTKDRQRALIAVWNKSPEGKRLKWVWHLKRYNITPEIYEAALKAQNSLCPICGTSSPGKKGWHIDHCHRTGRFRGLLCLKCNLGIGYLNDDMNVLKNAINYLST